MRWRAMTAEQQREWIRDRRREKLAIRNDWHARIVRHPRNQLFVLIAKIGGARRTLAHKPANRAWWLRQAPGIQRVIAQHDGRTGRAMHG